MTDGIPLLSNLNSLALHLKSLHVPGDPIVLTNVHDAATAHAVASLPATRALATGSFAIAATLGVVDEDTLSLAENLAGIARVARGLRNAGRIETVPLTADLQDGYADPAESVREAVRRGVVGCNIEDVDHGGKLDGGESKLRSIDDATSRIKAALRGARDAGVPDFVVNARTDVLGYGGGIDDAVERGKAFLEAGATTVFVWGVSKKVLSKEEIAHMAERLGGRLAVLKGGLPVNVLKECGVSRVSIGPMLFLKGLEVFKSEAIGILKEGQDSEKDGIEVM